MNKARVNKAQEAVFENTCIEIITDVFETPDYVEIKGECGGDLLRYRVYNDGTIAAK